MDAIETHNWMQQQYRLMEQYDTSEVSVLQRMKKIMIEKHSWDVEDFDGMSFLEIESAFLDDCGEPDFRPHEDVEYRW